MTYRLLTKRFELFVYKPDHFTKLSLFYFPFVPMVHGTKNFSLHLIVSQVALLKSCAIFKPFSIHTQHGAWLVEACASKRAEAPFPGASLNKGQ